MATSSSREERRRRIMSRGEDRLALITGKSHSLPPDRDFSDESSPRISAALLNAPVSKSLKHDTDVRVSGIKRYDEIVNQIERQNETREEAPAVQDMTKSQPAPAKSMVQNREGAPAVQDMIKSEPSPAISMVQKTSNDTQPIPKPTRVNQPSLFSCQKVHSCIISSQNIRSFCALILGLLVVLSYIDYGIFRINIVNSDWIAAFRPLYILLLTDVTIVLAQVLLGGRSNSEGEKEKVITEEEEDSLTQAVEVMEKGLVVYTITRAVFIDFSIYVVVVVCGLSLM